MTVEQFEDFLGEYTDQLESLDGSLTPLVNQMVNDLKSNAPVDKGDLRRSIVGGVRDNEVEFGWLNYGSFQNYGVSGTTDGLGEAVNEAVSPFPRSGNTYAFKTRKFGLTAQDWFDVDEMTRLITEELERITNIDTQ